MSTKSLKAANGQIVQELATTKVEQAEEDMSNVTGVAACHDWGEDMDFPAFE